MVGVNVAVGVRDGVYVPVGVLDGVKVNVGVLDGGTVGVKVTVHSGAESTFPNGYRVRRFSS